MISRMRETGIELAIDEGSAGSLPILVSWGRNGLPPLSVDSALDQRCQAGPPQSLRWSEIYQGKEAIGRLDADILRFRSGAPFVARARFGLWSPVSHLYHPLLQANDNKGGDLPELHQYLAAGASWPAGGRWCRSGL
jgi:hypothetical protein